eukprot:TRINITY_DN18235_c0_g1_i1.p1 TRINITY_DN18235_c0_g1~~TRINITY_DN18235_c0_g1_i1.p1  ORF type:complete len:113 (-),score=44.04 TRINITY_DN18235_c0_g1_i1:229-567(-)
MLSMISMNNVLPIRKETDEEKKAELKKKLETETIPSWLKMMEGLLTSKGGNHFAGNQLTWADIAIYHFFDLLKMMLGEPNMEEYPNIKKLMESVKSLPNIKKWEETRPNTPF